jgi:hypothetical protein
MVERRLVDTAQRLKQLKADLQVAEEQLAHFTDQAEDARIRSLVSETPLADKEHREARKHAESMQRYQSDLVEEIVQVEDQQNQLLDQLLEGDNDTS